MQRCSTQEPNPYGPHRSANQASPTYTMMHVHYMRRGKSDASSFNWEIRVSFVHLRRLRATRLARAEGWKGRAHRGGYKCWFPAASISFIVRLLASLSLFPLLRCLYIGRLYLHIVLYYIYILSSHMFKNKADACTENTICQSPKQTFLFFSPIYRVMIRRMLQSLARPRCQTLWRNALVVKLAYILFSSSQS